MSSVALSTAIRSLAAASAAADCSRDGCGAPALAGGGGEHVGDAGEAVADLVAERGDQRRLGAGQPLGLLQRGGALARQLFALGGQRRTGGAGCG